MAVARRNGNSILPVIYIGFTILICYSCYYCSISFQPKRMFCASADCNQLSPVTYFTLVFLVITRCKCSSIVPQSNNMTLIYINYVMYRRRIPCFKTTLLGIPIIAHFCKC